VFTCFRFSQASCSALSALPVVVVGRSSSCVARRKITRKNFFYPTTCASSPPASCICNAAAPSAAPNASGRRALPAHTVTSHEPIRRGQPRQHPVARGYLQSSVCAHTARTSDLLFNHGHRRTYYGVIMAINQCLPCHAMVG